MQNKNKARLLIFLIMLVIGSIIFFKYKNSSEKIYRNETPSKIREIKLLDNDKFVFVAVDNYLDDVILFGQNYITTFSSHTLDTTYMNYLGRIIYTVLFIIFLVDIYKMTMIT